MGYISIEPLTITAILTDEGKRKIAKEGNLDIKYAAFSDDGVDYQSMYNPETTDEKKGLAIENIPMLEPSSNADSSMRNLLITLPIGSVKIPILSIGQTHVILSAGQKYIITPTVLNYPNGNDIYGYKATVLDSSVVDIIPYELTPNSDTNVNVENSYFINDESKTVTGKQFQLIAKTLTEDRETKVIIQGIQTGGAIEIVVYVKKYTQ